MPQTTTSSPVGRPILDTIHGPEDVSRLDMTCLPQLAQEIRTELLEVISKTGGHLASNLGVVELTIALLRAFDPPHDKVVMDTSHQGYVYKLLTGRRELFKTLRQDNGCCGFLNREESEYDHFGAGHAGTAISAALGFAAARDNRGSDEKVIAIVGDGAMGNGISLEGLNNIVESTHDIVLILNDNKMSIGENVGALSRYFNRIISGHFYNQMKDATARAVDKIPAVGRPLRRGIRRVIEGTKSIFLPGGLFEDFGLKYVGPIDGHDIEELVHTFESVASLHEPVLIHVLTEKGRGYKFAKELPEVFHGTGQFDTKSGLPIAPLGEIEAKPVSFSEAYGNGLERLMNKDKRVVTITAGMCKGTGVDKVHKAFPKRFYDVGIAEEHAAVFAAGLAAAGLRPIVGIYATFMHRAVDCVLHDICLQNLPVVFCLDRAGVVKDGPTHHGIHDLAFWLVMPNLNVMQPMDARELEAMLKLAVTTGAPTIIRYPKGSAESIPDCAWTPLQLGEAVTLREGPDVAIWSLGRECVNALEIADTLEKQGISAAVVNPRFIAPLDTGLLFEQAAKMPVVTLEDHSLSGGLGELISLKLARAGHQSPLNIGWPAGTFIPHGSAAGLREKYELNNAGVVAKISQFLKLTNHEKIEELTRQLLLELGEDPMREGLINTPKRVAKSMAFLTSGYHLDPADVINDALFTVDSNDMVIVRDIEVYSLCEHHMLPFFGKCHIGYIPQGKVFGVSKLARLVDCFSRRLQLQERLTRQIARIVKDAVDAEGVGVVMECKHLCMMMRGVEKQNSQMITSSMLGSFHSSNATRNEFMHLVTGSLTIH